MVPCLQDPPNHLVYPVDFETHALRRLLQAYPLKNYLGKHVLGNLSFELSQTPRAKPS